MIKALVTQPNAKFVRGIYRTAFATAVIVSFLLALSLFVGEWYYWRSGWWHGEPVLEWWQSVPDGGTFLAATWRVLQLTVASFLTVGWAFFIYDAAGRMLLVLIAMRGWWVWFFAIHIVTLAANAVVFFWSAEPIGASYVMILAFFATFTLLTFGLTALAVACFVVVTRRKAARRVSS